MAKIVAILSICCVLALGALAAGLTWLHWHNVNVQAQSALSRELVRAKINTCRAAYESGGIPGLKSYIAGESASERNTTFVEILDSHKMITFEQEPAGSQDLSIPSPLKSDQPEGLNIPKIGHRRTWTIGRVVLPDGKSLFVGRMLDAAQEGA